MSLESSENDPPLTTFKVNKDSFLKWGPLVWLKSGAVMDDLMSRDMFGFIPSRDDSTIRVSIYCFAGGLINIGCFFGDGFNLKFFSCSILLERVL